jgi:two-component system cell cycle sensor histidine kinase/response regulator CckA
MSRILIVDDKEQDRYLLQILLQRSGYAVEVAADGAEALASARTNPPDMIVSDILMPVMDGFTLCREWRKDNALSPLPFVFYTATYTDPRDEEFALKLGADRFIVKPMEPALLLEMLKEVLSNPAQRKTGQGKSFSDEEEGYFKNYSEVLVRKLEDKLELFRAIFTIDPSAMFLLSPSYAILELNTSAEKALDVRGEDVLDKSFVDCFVPQAHRAAFIEQIETAFSGSTMRDFESTVRLADGSERTLVWNAQRIMRASGIVEGVLLIGNDITARRSAEKQRAQMEDQFRQAQKMEAIGQLAGGVAHDFNNILSAIMGYSDLMRLQLKKDDPLMEKVDQIVKCSDRAAWLTRQLLAFSRKQVLEPKVLNLNQVVSNVEKMLHRLIGADIELVTALAPDLGRVKADPGQIEQVIVNLVVNSRDAMPDGGKLTIETANVVLDENYAQQHVASVPGHYVMIAVSDTGCGMDEATMTRIFEPFFTTKEKGKGTGLGLATVYGIVKQSGGNIWCYSEPGKGTTFKVYLPQVMDEVPAAVPQKKGAKTACGTETILIAEDEETIRELASEMLSIAGYKVIPAANGGEALLACKNFKGTIHLLLTDVVMPQMSGKQLVQSLLELRPGLKVLFTSGYTDDAIVHHGFLDEGTPFLQKPFNMDTLTRKVRDVLDKS